MIYANIQALLSLRDLTDFLVIEVLKGHTIRRAVLCQFMGIE